MSARNHIRRVDLAQLRENIRAIRRVTPETAKVLAVVKADAYGHGMVQVARAALEAGAEYLAVAITEEGAELRRCGITAPILVLGATTPASALQGVGCGLTLTVCSPEMVDYVREAARQLHRTGEVHIKIDSGMCRIGCRTLEEVEAVRDAIAAGEGVALTGAFTHFADSDGETEAFTRQQFTCFKALTDCLPADIIRHCANSAAITRFPEYALDMVRAGIVMYGYPPVDTDLPVKPFMTWETEVTYVKDIQPGDTVSYGRTYTAQSVRRAATIAVGYGDGYHRATTGKAEVLIRGHRCPVIGRVCMDQMVVDVTDVPGVIPGDRVTLMGTDGEETISAEDIARWAGTISYEVLLAATGRVNRQWLHEDD